MFFSKRKEFRINKFWEWFKSYAPTIKSITKQNADLVLDRILEELQRIRPGLAIEITNGNDKRIKNLIISANGDINKFDLVEEIVSKAPKIENWTIVAFRQRSSDPDLSIDIPELIKFEVSKMYFMPLGDRENLDLIIFVPGIKGKPKEIIAYYGLILIDYLIGEYDSITKVRYYDFQDVEDLDASDQVLPLNVLPKFIDIHKK